MPPRSEAGMRSSALMRALRVRGRGEGWRMLPSATWSRGPRPPQLGWRQAFRFATPLEVLRMESGSRRLSSVPVVQRLPRLQIGLRARAREIVVFLFFALSRFLHLRKK